MLKLYSGDLSPFSARVRMQIYAKGITDIDLERPAHFGSPKFREEFPLGRIPILEVDGDVIPESDVIAEYLEQIYPEPSMLGESAKETAHIRLIARIADIYIMNNMFMLSPQTRATTRDQGVIDLLGGQVVRNIKALDRLIGKDGFACFSRVTMADCALVPGLFLVENVLHLTGVDNPISRNENVAAYWDTIQKNEFAAQVLAELHRGLEERRRMIRDGSFQRFMAAAAAET